MCWWVDNRANSRALLSMFTSKHTLNEGNLPLLLTCSLSCFALGPGGSLAFRVFFFLRVSVVVGSDWKMTLHPRVGG